MYKKVDKFCVSKEGTVRDTISRMNETRLGIVLVVDAEKHFVGIISDGDIRRAVLAGIDLNGPLSKLLALKSNSPYAKPITAPVGTSREKLLKLIREHGIQGIPLLDADSRVVELITSSAFLPDKALGIQAVIMAGGKGERLRPLTEDLPKPMLPVGDRPLLEIIIKQLREAGIKNVGVTTHHKPEKITEHFGDGTDFGVHLSYVSEDRPLGTAGALGLMKARKEPLLVINGDVLTEVDFKAMVRYHKEHEADLTVAVRSYDLKVPFGVVECEASLVKQLKEKPNFNFLVNAGIYLLEPVAHRYIPTDTHYNMTDLIQRLIQEKCRVVSFPIHEYWLDIGGHAEYLRAQEYDK